MVAGIKRISCRIFVVGRCTAGLLCDFPLSLYLRPFDITCLSDLPKIGGDEVRDPGRGRGAKLADRILNDTIRVRHALVLPEVLEP